MDDNLLKKKIIIWIGIFIVLGIGISFFYSYYKNMQEETQEIIDTNTEDLPVEKVSNQEETIKVDIKGEVKNPNIYNATASDRVIDIIEKAGGLTKNADTSILNLSKKVKDEMVIIIYSKEEIKEYEKTKEKQQQTLEICTQETIKNDACIDSSETADPKEEPATTGLININTATLEQLQTLPRIGESKAEEIIRYREENGPFEAIEDIKNVSGIGDSIFDQIKDSITI